MRPRLQAVAGSQCGVFFRHQALACGYSDMEVRELKRTREWLVVRRGAYVEARVAPPQGDTEGWHRLRTLAVLHHVQVPSVASHTSAVGLLRLPHWGTDLSNVYLTRSRSHAGRIEAGVSHHEAELPDWQTTTVAGVTCTNGARTAWDIGREFGFEAGVVVSDAVLRIGRENERRGSVGQAAGPQAGATRSDLDLLAELMADWPKARAATEAFAFADAGAESTGVLATSATRSSTTATSSGRRSYARALRGLGKNVSRLVWADLFGSRRRQAGAALWRTAERIGAPPEWTRPNWFRAA